MLLHGACVFRVPAGRHDVGGCAGCVRRRRRQSCHHQDGGNWPIGSRRRPFRRRNPARVGGAQQPGRCGSVRVEQWAAGQLERSKHRGPALGDQQVLAAQHLSTLCVCAQQGRVRLVSRGAGRRWLHRRERRAPQRRPVRSQRQCRRVHSGHSKVARRQGHVRQQQREHLPERRHHMPGSHSHEADAQLRRVLRVHGGHLHRYVRRWGQ